MESAIPPSALEIPEEELPAPGDPLKLEFSQVTEVDLSRQFNSSLTEQVDAVFLDAIDYRVVNNEMNVSLADVTLHVAPMGTPGAGHPDAIPLGTISVISASTDVETRPFPLSAQGHRALKHYVMEGSFLLFVSGTALASGVDEPPVGGAMVELDVRGSVHRY